METGTVTCNCGAEFKGTKEEIAPAIGKHAQEVHPKEVEGKSEEDMAKMLDAKFVPDEPQQ